MKERCLKCRQKKILTRHHILPRRFYGSPPDAPILLICRSCHDDLEILIPQQPKMERHQYWIILFQFLNRSRVIVVDWCGENEYEVMKDEVFTMQAMDSSRL